jgi:hypothetical protein
MGRSRSSFFVGIAYIGYQRSGLNWRGFHVNLTAAEGERFRGYLPQESNLEGLGLKRLLYFTAK